MRSAVLVREPVGLSSTFERERSMSNGNAPRTSVPDTDAYAKLTMDDGSDMPITSPTMGDIIASRFGRREMMKGLLAATAITAVSTPLTTMLTTRAEARSAGSASASPAAPSRSSPSVISSTTAPWPKTRRAQS